MFFISHIHLLFSYFYAALMALWKAIVIVWYKGCLRSLNFAILCCYLLEIKEDLCGSTAKNHVLSQKNIFSLP